MINKKIIIVDILNKISDEAFQRDVWLNQKYWDKILNLGEAINTLDDYSFFEDVEEDRFKFCDIKDKKKLKLFANKLISYEEPDTTQKLLNDLEWKEITELASDIHNLLNEYPTW